MPNIITIELCQEDRARLDKILAALEAGHECKNCVDAVTEAMDTMTASEIAPQTNENTEKEEEPAEPEKAPEIEETEPEQPAVDREDIRRKVVELTAAGKKAAARDIVKGYAGTISGIPDDKLAEVWKKLIELEA